MPLHSLGCGSGALVLTAAVALLLVPAPYLMPDVLSSRDNLENTLPRIVEIEAATNRFTFEHILSQYPSLDLFPNVIMLVIGVVVYLFEWIHRKLMERRILKLRAQLGASAARLRAGEERQTQLEGALRLARAAAAEYSLLLYLLLRRRRARAPAPAPGHAFKDDDFALLPVPTLDA